MDSHPMPKSFVIDHHDGQLAVLCEVFPGSRIALCANNSGENIRHVMGTQSPVIGAFGDLIHKERDEKVFLDKLKAESELHVAGTRRRNILGFLEEHPDHCSSKRFVILISEKAS
jgi:hypothetical protein